MPRLLTTLASWTSPDTLGLVGVVLLSYHAWFLRRQDKYLKKLHKLLKKLDKSRS